MFPGPTFRLYVKRFSKVKPNSFPFSDAASAGPKRLSFVADALNSPLLLNLISGPKVEVNSSSGVKFIVKYTGAKRRVVFLSSIYAFSTSSDNGLDAIPSFHVLKLIFPSAS